MKPEKPARRYTIGSSPFVADALAPGLYIVATPIGNLGDMTLRGLASLAAADAILCEDTRTTAKLLDRFGIRNRLEPYHEHNAAKVRPGLLARLRDGAALTLVSDAGMPLVSDPGYRLVAEAVAQGTAVTCCPGASAVATALALSGLPNDRFAFLGFVPQKLGERRRLFDEVGGLNSTLIFFESPHRIVETLETIAATWPDRPVAVARELTKLHEEMLRGGAAELAALLKERPVVKGEITLVVGPPAATERAVTAEQREHAIDEALAIMPAGKAASVVARQLGLSRKEVYALILARREARP
ncbi:MAG: 16S rRNA (cytidine(1402)-2'-O)-methyltransferase [Rhizobiales bacterium]|nr:16S rRNA (cytidine(1402)-2'-O)-methyltransferase [Hyphomicrobiales bacterium]MBI3674390.1 16S rRNA (cytidine(1402)-2'-O)-methyltransferase [Hyphomicrobiales bacterium]